MDETCIYVYIHTCTNFTECKLQLVFTNWYSENEKKFMLK